MDSSHRSRPVTVAPLSHSSVLTARARGPGYKGCPSLSKKRKTSTSFVEGIEKDAPLRYFPGDIISRKESCFEDFFSLYLILCVFNKIINVFLINANTCVITKRVFTRAREKFGEMKKRRERGKTQRKEGHRGERHYP